MKKVILMLCMFGLLTGCTNKEQNQKIISFWTQQVMEAQMALMAKTLKGASLPPDLMASMKEMGKDPLAEKTENPEIAPVAKKAAPVATPKVQDPIPAQLFLSDSCGWCQKLKRSGFPSKFKKKYSGEVDLKIYEVHSAEGSREFSRAVKKHKLSGGVPLMIIGSSVIPGYSDNMMAIADEKVRLELKKRGPVATGPAVVSITMEDDKIAGPASDADKAKMKRYLSQVRENNEATLYSLSSMFANKQIWDEALAIITKTENQLKRVANVSSSYEAFTKVAKPLEQSQQQQIEALIRQNAKKIR